MNYVEVAIPFFILAMGLEYLYGRLVKKNTYRLSDTVNSLQLGVLSRLVDILRLGLRRRRIRRAGEVDRRTAVVDGLRLAMGRRVRRV